MLRLASVLAAAFVVAFGLAAAVDEPQAPPPTAPATPAAPAGSTDPAVSPAATAPSTPARGTGQIRGTISYGRHAPAVGVVVTLAPEDGGSRVYVATTGETGTFGFDGVPDGTYRGSVRREGYVPVVKSGVVVRAPFRAVVELTLVRGATPPEPPKDLEGDASLTGSVRIAGGAPLAEARVRLVRPDAKDDPRSALTDPSGGFSFAGLKAGRWRLELIGAGLLPLRTDLDLTGAVVLDAALARQPANYQPLPQDLIVPEDVIPPKE
jgi:hypothetical protein